MHRSTRFAPRLRRPEIYLLLGAALCGALLFAKLHVGDLPGYDDAVYAHEGREMLRTGDWWNVSLNGRPDFDKPPLFIWLEAASLRTFGVSDFAARLPAALAGLGTVLLVFFLARELSHEPWLPALAMFVMMTTQYFMRYAMHAMTDVPFTFFFTLAMLCYVKGLRRPGFFLPCGLAIAGAILTRSVLGAIPLAIIAAHLAHGGRAATLRSRSLVAGCLVALGLPLVWFASQYLRHGEPFLAGHVAFMVENLPEARGGGVGGFLQYPLFLLRDYWPWLPAALAGLALQIGRLRRGPDPAASLLCLWIALLIVPFSLLEIKTLRYVMPVFPAFAILAAGALNRWIPERRKSVCLKAAYVSLGCALLVMAALPKYRTRPEEMRRLAPVAQAHTDSGEAILLYTRGERRWDLVHQVIWYAERHCEHLTDVGELRARLGGGARRAAIMDRATFTGLGACLGRSAEVLGETESFVCFRLETLLDAARHAPAPPAEE